MSDTSEITNECLVHYDSSHIQTRRDFMGICLIDETHFEEKPKEKPNQECMAKIIRIMETLTNHAKAQWKLAALKAKEKGLDIPPEPKEYPIELANSAIVSLIYETFGESMVRNSLDYLVELGYLKRWQEKKNTIPIYWFQFAYVQTLLEQQAKSYLAGCDFKPPHMQGVISNPKPVKSHPKRVKSNPNPPISKGAGFESTDNNNYSYIGESSLEEETYAFSDENAAPEPIDFKTASGKFRAVKPGDVTTDASSQLPIAIPDTPSEYSHMYIGNDDLEDDVEEPTEKVPVTKPEHTAITKGGIDDADATGMPHRDSDLPGNSDPVPVGNGAVSETGMPAATVTTGMPDTTDATTTQARRMVGGGDDERTQNIPHRENSDRTGDLPLRSEEGVQELTQVATQQKPGVGSPLPSAGTPPGAGHGDAAGDQAILDLGGITPAQHSGVSPGSPARPGAVQAGAGLKITHAPTHKPVTQEKMHESKEPKELTPKQREQAEQAGLKRRCEEIYVVYGQAIGRKPSHSKANTDGALLLARDGVSDEDITTTTKAILADSFMAKNLSLTFVYSKLDALARKPIPGQQNDPPVIIRPASKVRSFNGIAANG